MSDDLNWGRCFCRVVSTMSLVSIDNYSEHMERSAQRTLDTLDKLDERMTSHFDERRAHVRKKIRGQAKVLFPSEEASGVTSQPSKVWARSLSSGGMSFIYPEELPLAPILVGLEFPGVEPVWFEAEIVRAKNLLSEEFWEFGVRFLNRTTV